MRMAHGNPAPAYNVQTAVDAEHAIIVAQQVTTESNDERSLLPMAEAAQQALVSPETLNVVADAGYSNGEHAAVCEASGIVPHVAGKRGANVKGDGTLFDRTAFVYQPETDTLLCPAGQTLRRKQLSRRDRAVCYQGEARTCGRCQLKSQCTVGRQRLVKRHLYDDVLNRMHQRATPAVMRLRRSTVEHPFATLKYSIL